MTPKDSKIICLIPARYGSKGVVNKNIKMIKGKPLIAHAIEKAKKSNIFSKIIVSTDHKKIQKISEKFGAEVPFIRPKKFANDTSSMNDVVLHTIKTLEKLDYSFEQIFLYDVTTFFLESNDIIRMKTLFDKSDVHTVILSYKTHLNPYFNIAEINSKGYLKLVKEIKNNPKNRQDAPVVYQLNGLYTIDTKKFLKNGKKIFKQMYPCEIPIENGLMIDTKFEFKIAKLIIENSK